ncbi:SDR family oxidoreductase [Pimelobacter simplex]|uniref:SDR family oxidoreductase n=1 Tax=Nocardioides simplex TaxID=2045 RepID=UPI003AAA9BED
MASRLAIVTGGSRGVGAATARRLAREGWNVLVTYHSDKYAAREVVADCVAAGVWASAVRADVADEAQVDALYDGLPAEAEAGPLRALVNNAGIVAPASDVADMGADRIRRTLDVNVVGTLLCARNAVRVMATGRGGAGGAIVNVSSRAAVLGSAHEYVDYAAAKAAVDAVTTGLAVEAAVDGIRVNSVRLGLMATEIHARNGAPDRLDRLAPSVPLGRAGTVEEAAAAICWLVGEEASYTTGAHLDVAGGR